MPRLRRTGWNGGMMGGDGIPALGGTADRRPAVDPTASVFSLHETHEIFEAWLRLVRDVLECGGKKRPVGRTTPLFLV